MKKLQILIFEDEPSMASLLKQIVLMSGHDVQVYSDPTICPIYHDHGFECPRETPCADVIISDQKMPNISGFDFFKLQRNRGCKALDKNKALITAGEISHDLRSEMDEIGFHYIKKPFRVTEITHWIDECSKRVQSVSSQNGDRGLILVEMADGTMCRIAKTALSIFLDRGEVKRFKRSVGWFIFGRDPLRCSQNNKTYTGIERREVI